MAGGALAFADELEQLPRAALTALASDTPRALVEQLVRCAGADLARGHVGRAAKYDSEALATEWRALGRDAGELSRVYGVVSALLVQFARENPVGAAAQRQALADLGLDDPEFAAFVLPLVVAAVSPIQRVLAHSSFDFAHVVDVAWRLDYVLRSSTAGSVHEPLYFVQLKLQPPSGEIEHLEFTCSVDELRDLVYRLEEAVNEVEKLASGRAAPASAAAAAAGDR